MPFSQQLRRERLCTLLMILVCIKGNVGYSLKCLWSHPFLCPLIRREMLWRLSLIVVWWTPLVHPRLVMMFTKGNPGYSLECLGTQLFICPLTQRVYLQCLISFQCVPKMVSFSGRVLLQFPKGNVGYSLECLWMPVKMVFFHAFSVLTVSSRSKFLWSRTHPVIRHPLKKFLLQCLSSANVLRKLTPSSAQAARCAIWMLRPWFGCKVRCLPVTILFEAFWCNTSPLMNGRWSSTTKMVHGLMMKSDGRCSKSCFSITVPYPQVLDMACSIKW